jgi:transketolase
MSRDAMAILTPSPRAVRRTILEMIHGGQASHLGTSMSLVEILIAVYGACDTESIRAERAGRDRVFVSKGHGAAATYAVMHHFGLMDAETIATYHRNGSALAGHVSHAVAGVEHSTGALGHGLPVAAGAAYGLRSAGHPQAKVFCVLGDGEMQEGAVWEALMFAAHHRLSRLVPIIDNNGISSIKRTSDVLDMEPLQDRFAAFGFDVHRVDGHDVSALTSAVEEIFAGDRPSVIVADTVKGRGIPFAEAQPIWHYRTLDAPLYADALAACEEEL